MFYDSIIWTVAVGAGIEFAASGSLIAVGLLVLLVVIQIVRVVRNQRRIAF